ncbi:hypothetical protein PV327_007408 [Microctonus hyperodae]|uniref:DDE Tnp4 domain-containing protein n=1 Tax=Microctonus hyperodae TaxID=165561 RepID=A0AA39KYN8_MICHY|nr:hypothetical protein PV327_007408 [Microctonus hyperodae]
MPGCFHSDYSITKVIIDCTKFRIKIPRSVNNRKSDSQLTIKSELLDILENGEIVLADKNFPKMKTVIDASDQKLKMVMATVFKEEKRILNGRNSAVLLK